MAIARELSALVAMTPDDTATWRLREVAGGAAYVELEHEKSAEIDEIIKLCADEPARLYDEWEVLSEKASTVLRLSNFVIKIFNFAPATKPWERESKAGLCAVRTAVMKEYGLARASRTEPFNLPNQESSIELAAPHIYGCFLPDQAPKSFWVMSYEEGQPKPEVITPIELGELEKYQNKIFRHIGGEVFIGTVRFNADCNHWLAQSQGGEISRLVNLGGSIFKDSMSQHVWECSDSLFVPEKRDG